MGLLMDLGPELAEVLPELQRQAEALMLDSCVIERAPAEPWVTDPETGRDVPAPWTVVYEGIGKSQSHQTYALTPDVGGATETVQRDRFDIPAADRMATLLASGRVSVWLGPVRIGDRILARGRVLRVAGLHDKTFQTAQRLPVDELH